MRECSRLLPQVSATAIVLAAIILPAPAMGQSELQQPSILAKNVATCLQQARAALGPSIG